jgi:hypothetical protein
VVKVVLALGVVWLGLVILETFAGTALARGARRQQAEWDSPAGKAAVKASHATWLKAQAAALALKTPEQRTAEYRAWSRAVDEGEARRAGYRQ